MAEYEGACEYCVLPGNMDAGYVDVGRPLLEDQGSDAPCGDGSPM